MRSPNVNLPLPVCVSAVYCGVCVCDTVFITDRHTVNHQEKHILGLTVESHNCHKKYFNLLLKSKKICIFIFLILYVPHVETISLRLKKCSTYSKPVAHHVLQIIIILESVYKSKNQHFKCNFRK